MIRPKQYKIRGHRLLFHHTSRIRGKRAKRLNKMYRHERERIWQQRVLGIISTFRWQVLHPRWWG